MVFHGVEGDGCTNHSKFLEGIRILPPHWNANFAMEDEREKRRVVKEADELSTLIAQLKLGGEELLI